MYSDFDWGAGSAERFGSKEDAGGCRVERSEEGGFCDLRSSNAEIASRGLSTTDGEMGSEGPWGKGEAGIFGDLVVGEYLRSRDAGSCGGIGGIGGELRSKRDGD